MWKIEAKFEFGKLQIINKVDSGVQIINKVDSGGFFLICVISLYNYLMVLLHDFICTLHMLIFRDALI